MLMPHERALLIIYCHDHLLAECPQCSEPTHPDQLIITEARDFCRHCRADLTSILRNHLAECTVIRAQARELAERARETRRQSWEVVKHSQQLRDDADVLAREAEFEQERARQVKRGQNPDSRASRRE
jgi:hypothetical protein